MRDIVIAIDGYSACGKSTTARKVARKLGYVFIDTGAMYRAVALYFLRHDIPVENGNAQMLNALNGIELEFHLNKDGEPEMWMNGERVEDAIRTIEVSSIVSEVAAIPAVRRKLVAQQQAMGRKKRVVLDGRDIGTVVFPDAELKIFMSADLDERIGRRQKELERKGAHLEEQQIRKNLLHRDHIDTTRDDSPLMKADDAVEIDTTNLTVDEQTEIVVKLAKEKML